MVRDRKHGRVMAGHVTHVRVPHACPRLASCLAQFKLPILHYPARVPARCHLSYRQRYFTHVSLPESAAFTNLSNHPDIYGNPLYRAWVPRAYSILPLRPGFYTEPQKQQYLWRSLSPRIWHGDSTNPARYLDSRSDKLFEATS
jgi:hypothetical protein